MKELVAAIRNATEDLIVHESGLRICRTRVYDDVDGLNVMYTFEPAEKILGDFKKALAAMIPVIRMVPHEDWDWVLFTPDGAYECAADGSLKTELPQYKSVFTPEEIAELHAK